MHFVGYVAIPYAYPWWGVQGEGHWGSLYERDDLLICLVIDYATWNAKVG